MKRLAIIGSGDLGQLIAYHAIHSHSVVGFYDDFITSVENKDLRILGPTTAILNDFQNGIFDELMVGVGYRHFAFRESIFDQLQPNIPFATIIHPSSYVDPSVKIGSGSIIFPGCTLDYKVKTGSNVLFNTGVVVAHDSYIGDQSFISPGVKIAGFVEIGKRCNIGIGSTIIDNINVVDDVQTGGGTVVINNLKKSGLYVGNPARFIR